MRPFLCISVITHCFHSSGISSLVTDCISDFIGFIHMSTFCLNISVGILSFPVALLSFGWHKVAFEFHHFLYLLLDCCEFPSVKHRVSRRANRVYPEYFACVMFYWRVSSKFLCFQNNSKCYLFSIFMILNLYSVPLHHCINFKAMY